MSKQEAVKLAENSVGFSQMMCEMAEFLFFINKTNDQRDLLLKARNKLSWDIKTYNKLVSEIRHDGDNVNNN